MFDVKGFRISMVKKSEIFWPMLFYADGFSNQCSYALLVRENRFFINFGLLRFIRGSVSRSFPVPFPCLVRVCMHIISCCVCLLYNWPWADLFLIFYSNPSDLLLISTRLKMVIQNNPNLIKMILNVPQAILCAFSRINPSQPRIFLPKMDE